MGVMRDSDMLWDELIDAFANIDERVVYFFDRETAEIFFVPVDYDDEAFWEEVARDTDRYLRIPHFDYEQERLLMYEFISSVQDQHLRAFLAGAFTGQNVFGRVEEILTFYPEEYERLVTLKEKVLTDSIHCWMGEYDLLADPSF
jgi:hypothetical protein